MEQLEPKHLAPYLPYGLKFMHDGKELTLFGIELPSDQNPLWITGLIKYKEGQQRMSVFPQGCEPILRPLSDLLNHDLDYWIDMGEVMHFASVEHFVNALIHKTDYSMYVANYEVVRNWLLERHFDIDGLIDTDLAIDINTLKG